MILGVILLSLPHLCLTPANAEITLNTDGEKSNLGVFPYFLEAGRETELFVQVSRTHLDHVNFSAVAVRFSVDGGKSYRLKQMTYIPQENVWRVNLGRFDLEKDKVLYEVIAEDGLSEKFYKDNGDGSSLSFPYYEKKAPSNLKKFPRILDTRVLAPPDQKLSSNEDVLIRVEENFSGADGFVRYTTDNWKTHFDEPFNKSDQRNRWVANIGKHPDGTKIEFAAMIKDKDGNPRWDNNNKKNYELKVGQNGYLPGDAEIAEIKNKIKDLPLRPLTAPTAEYLKKHKVYITLTTSPDRLSNIHHTIDTLDLDSVSKVVLTLPKYFKNDPKQEYSEAQISFLKRKYGDKIEIVRPEHDLGVITKTFYTFDRLKKIDPKAIVVSIDDDIAYQEGMVRELAASAVHNPHWVVSGSGEDLKYWGIPRFGFIESRDKEFDQAVDGRKSFSPCDVIEGYGAVAYRPELMDLDLLRKLSQLPGIDGKYSCRLSDDLVISFALALTGVARAKINTQYYSQKGIIPYPFGLGADALHHGAGMSEVEESTEINAQKYRQCYRDMIQEVYDLVTLKLKPEYRRCATRIRSGIGVRGNDSDDPSCKIRYPTPPIKIEYLDPILNPLLEKQ